MSIPSFELRDGTSIPWLGWGNGTGDAGKTPVESGSAALEAGIRHIDTAQVYKNEGATGEVVEKSGLKREEIYVTSKGKLNLY
jgi:diketogulonate reductase-like aldo/keto reductase